MLVARTRFNDNRGIGEIRVSLGGKTWREGGSSVTAVAVCGESKHAHVV